MKFNKIYRRYNRDNIYLKFPKLFITFQLLKEKRLYLQSLSVV